MNINLFCLPTFILALILYRAGYLLMRRATTPPARLLLIAGGAVAAAPAVLFTVYYLHVLDDALWFYAFRALPGTELTAAGAGLLAGMLQQYTAGRRILFAAWLASSLSLLCMLLAVPYLKPVLMPAALAECHDEWSEGVCLQSLPYTCGPASAATLARMAGVRVTERALARECFTSSSSTENWYLARALRRRGLRVTYLLYPERPDRLPHPAIAGTNLHTPSGPGHFIVIFAETPDHYLIGDPLRGKVLLKKHDWQPYHFTGFFMRVEKR